ncbi:adenylyl-sulfate kinase [Sulfuritortus calidifontis]|uniref:adenylyl-sulfate kinase n=1 Tax=Sulfuritortus calidifontis TaxID=1914471 RepID=UPI000F82A557|nr:adenylyl-sulfate kinase [Sulfuritortus calidifontis]
MPRNPLKIQKSQKNITWHSAKINQEIRQSLIGHKAVTIWLTGLSASGKSSIAFELERCLLNARYMAYVLDGDNVRHGLCRDLGFSQGDRHENIRRVAEVARLMNDAGIIVISAFISPYREDRENARHIIGDGRFIETYLDASLQICELRDPKGLYRRARMGDLPDFTGISAPYEAPEAPKLRIETGALSLKQSVDRIINYLSEHGIIAGC